MSVCIVHRDGWAVADSRDSMGTCIMPTTATKVSKAEGYLIAHVGEGIISQKINRIVKKSGHEITILDSISDMMDETDHNCEALAVSYKRELIHLDGHGLLSPIDQTDFWAIGCCEQFVLGRLLMIAESRSVTVEDAKAAIVAASKYDSGIDDRVQEFYLDRV